MSRQWGTVQRARQETQGSTGRALNRRRVGRRCAQRRARDAEAEYVQRGLLSFQHTPPVLRRTRSRLFINSLHVANPQRRHLGTVPVQKGQETRGFGSPRKRSSSAPYRHRSSRRLILRSASSFPEGLAPNMWRRAMRPAACKSVIRIAHRTLQSRNSHPLDNDLRPAAHPHPN